MNFRKFLVEILGNGVKSRLTKSNVEGMFCGAVAGETAGIAVKDFSREQIAKYPLTDITIFTLDYDKTICVNALIEYAQFLVDNLDKNFSAERLLKLVDEWYVLKIKEENQRLKLMLPYAFWTGVVFSRFYDLSVIDDKLLRNLPNLLCDIGIASSLRIFFIATNLAKGLSLTSSIKNAKRESRNICKKIGLYVGNQNVSIKVCKLIECSVLDFKTSKTAIIKTANRVFYPDLTACIVGMIMGFYKGIDDIPSEWSLDVNIPQFLLSDKIF